MIKHCKIIGTLGPSSSNVEVLEQLFKNGLDIVRLNFSHGSHEDHLKSLQLIRHVAKKAGKNIAVLQDLQGPKIRCGRLIDGQQTIANGETYIIEFGVEQKKREIIPIDYPGLARDVAVGQSVMMDDGLFKAEITAIDGPQVHVKFIYGGLLKSRKGVNLPDAKVSLPAMTEKDHQDLLFGVRAGVDFIALSFVQDPADIIHCKKMIQALGADTPVIAKIEKLPAITDIDAIAAVSDGLMVARGDLGVEASIERVPHYQRIIVQAAKRHGKPVIVATQMLESMINNPRATLAELADVANGVLDGADCLMLSGEVAAGKFPVECVKTMNSTICEVESWSLRKQSVYAASNIPEPTEWTDNEAIARAASEAADKIHAKAIVCLTLTGSIAKSIARWRPQTPIIAISPRPDVVTRLSMIWGVYGIQNPEFANTDLFLQNLPKFLLEQNLVESGDMVVMTAGIPIQAMLPTNMIKINRIP